MAVERHKHLLDAEQAVLLVIDVQERFASHIVDFEKMVANIGILVEAATLLSVPVVVTEQYRKGLGETVASIKAKLLPDVGNFEKSCFSATGSPEVASHLAKLGRNQVIVCGIETHVCVNQTVHDLLRLGYQVHLVTDAVSSRSAENKLVGLAKMYAAGALPSSVECCLFEMLVESGTERFKAVQKLVK